MCTIFNSAKVNQEVKSEIDLPTTFCCASTISQTFTPVKVAGLLTRLTPVKYIIWSILEESAYEKSLESLESRKQSLHLGWNKESVEEEKKVTTQTRLKTTIINDLSNNILGPLLLLFLAENKMFIEKDEIIDISLQKYLSFFNKNNRSVFLILLALHITNIVVVFGYTMM